MGVQGDISSLHVSMAAGLALVVIIQMFGHISGAHVNPVVTMAAFILDEVTTKQVPVYVICQILGCLAGSGFHKILTPSESYIVGNSTEPGVCLNVPRGNVTEWQALGVEIILTTALVIAVCATWDQVNSNKTDSIPLRIGLIIVSLNVSAGAYTGASMNPARSLGPAVWTNNYTSHWVYWVGPTIGSLIASYFYKYIFLTGR
ncbi:aquaporin-4 isoform X2 [Leptinotarsa decemlineata]